MEEQVPFIDNRSGLLTSGVTPPRHHIFYLDCVQHLLVLKLEEAGKGGCRLRQFSWIIVVASWIRPMKVPICYLEVKITTYLRLIGQTVRRMKLICYSLNRIDNNRCVMC